MSAAGHLTATSNSIPAHSNLQYATVQPATGSVTVVVSDLTTK